MGFIGLGLRSLAVFALMARAAKRKSLTPRGLVAAVITGLVHAIHPWSIFTVLLFTFFITGTAFTRVKANVKRTLTASSTGEGGGEGPRNEIQVLANSLPATILILIHFFTKTTKCWNSDVLTVGIIAQYAAVTADTWSSELGILSQQSPILITTLRKCPPGTNGGVSRTGLTAALGGGAIIGLMVAMFAPFCHTWSIMARLKLVVAITIAGFGGSVLDSLLGAFLQQSVVNDRGKVIEVEGGMKMDLKGKVISGKNILSNNQVNLVMATLTTLLSMVIAKIYYRFR
ncbi:integral membrane protein DUF92-domain-containing protein [Lipomyces tetrasporus]|uniref:Integral membrane protein DUF92-domain-containing protein n=1 Tax=Lipomyces tetrasporus TaxID=54092 RepID=A0AAD7VPV1_9ASCO|nr:integral membrane protein DUF92-domain-containing protein [Lipomyces tetrasporus]KAJ8098227.1 integral membrane protein DUF92-domain-containing protein [Lipomyces tetrasporus]